MLFKGKKEIFLKKYLELPGKKKLNKLKNRLETAKEIILHIKKDL